MDATPHSTDLSKKELRQRLRRVMSEIPVEDLQERSAEACHRLIATEAYRQSEMIMVFLSLPTEVETKSLVLHAWRDRKRILAPKVSWEQRRMLPIEIVSLSDNISETSMGLREPAKGVPIPLSNIDMVVVPGLGFDIHGNRIGRGRGFYDAFLAHDGWAGLACGLALEEQVVPQVPMSEHDMKVDMLVTDAEVRIFRNQPAGRRAV